uniref:Uncharacterized protein n=1 Tax=Arundo donax TaxID=35708 RepID=A0A0A8YUG6_ARUDO
MDNSKFDSLQCCKGLLS